MKIALSSFATILLMMSGFVASQSEPTRSGDARTPILVELFTSEGCSSCPPADRLLERLDQQPVSGAELIVLSEHVDYWNHIGWKDPYSDPAYSQRQGAYGDRFSLDSVYTPQMVVDGTSQFTGSNSELAYKAITKALASAKIPIRLSAASVDAENVLKAHIEIQDSPVAKQADVYTAVALNRAESQVSGGENSGRKLTHVSVVRNLTKVGQLKPGQSWAKDVQFKLQNGSSAGNLRLIAFVQEPNTGRVLGATLQSLDAR